MAAIRAHRRGGNLFFGVNFEIFWSDGKRGGTAGTDERFHEQNCNRLPLREQPRYHVTTMEQKIDLAIGGQALIEGVMMRSPHFVSIAVRKKDGTIVKKIHEQTPWPKKLGVAKVPLVRGVLSVIEMMVTGAKALDFATEQYVEEVEEINEKKEGLGTTTKPISKSKIQSVLEGLGLIVSLILSLGLGFVLFKFVPLYLTEFLRSKFTILQTHYILFNAVDGIIRIAIFFAYISFLFIFKSFRRVFEYHGAEHMSIHAYEHKKELIPSEVAKFSPEHPRCGTSFLMAALIVSIIVYSFVPRQEVFWINLALRFSILPLIVGIGYEILKWSAKHVEHPLMKIIIAPGIMTQYITTQKPDTTQIEVALAALTNALEHEEAYKNSQK